ncbi:MAG TPA: N-acetyl-gamma-glutamyl-phosphate reductase [Acidimicrobiales bacterium]|nr:MAG: N-acetyl-gamma-glutamyl-phosphate reductase [Actinobacteria bacterium 21-73-9]HQU26529.1 N-acetyl-gamma-glutamyl-phosphate reductase [Acidimicrobiales bacterium]
MRVGVVGASGYAGSEVVRLGGSHPDLEVVLVTGESSAGVALGAHVPALAARFPDLVLEANESVLEAELDLVFLALPHGKSQALVARLVERGVAVVDLGADFRLKDPALYAAWYGEAHREPGLLARAVYGLVERHREELVGATLIAAPGCYPTATALALGPFVDEGVVEREGIVVDALSGASGAGRATSDRLHFSRLAANAEAYGLTRHRHTPEMEAELAASLLFTPHLVPVARGMLVTAYARLAEPLTTEAALGLLAARYAHDPCVVVTESPPTLKDPVGSNLCFVSAAVDARTGWLVAMSSIDNLVKGAAGQALQAWNVASGRPETLGLPLTGVTP